MPSKHRAAPAATRIGCDIEEDRNVGLSEATFGSRYLERVFHPSEIDQAESFGGRGRRVAFLTGRFAAKEALFKTLGADDADTVLWRDIEIAASPGGPEPVLHRSARGAAARSGLTAFSVSISHGRGFAVAAAVAIAALPPSSPHPSERKAPTPVNDTRMDDRIREILAAHARLDTDASALAAGDDLYAAGMSSHASINVMLALEDEFDIEFPETALTRSTFASIERIRSEVKALDLD